MACKNLHTSKGYKISIIRSQHSLAFSSIKKLCNKNLNFTICFGFCIIQYMIQEMVFRLFALSKVWAGKFKKANN